MVSTTTFYDNSANLSAVGGIAFNSSGLLYVVNQITGELGSIDSLSQYSPVSNFGYNTIGVVCDGDGNIYVSNYDTNKIFKITSGGSVSTFVTSGLSGPTGLAFDGDGNLYCSNNIANTISVITPGQVVTTCVAITEGLNGPLGLAFGGGFLYCCNNYSSTISKITISSLIGTVTRTYTDDSIMSNVEGLVYSSIDSSLYFTNTQTNVCQINLTSVIPVYSIFLPASTGFFPQGLAIKSNNYLYISSYDFPDETTSKVLVTTDPVCFNEDTKILCLNHSLEEEYVPIQDLKKGDLVKTYLHGYRKVDLIHKGVLFNNPNKWNQCMYKMEKTEENGLLEDLIVTGGHSILVDEFTETEKEKLNKNGVKEYIYKIDDKYLLFASASDHFVPLTDNEKYNYYHLTLENNGDGNQQFGIWANGILTETTCNDYLLNHT